MVACMAIGRELWCPCGSHFIFMHPFMKSTRTGQAAQSAHLSFTLQQGSMSSSLQAILPTDPSFTRLRYTMGVLPTVGAGRSDAAPSCQIMYRTLGNCAPGYTSRPVPLCEWLCCVHLPISSVTSFAMFIFAAVAVAFVFVLSRETFCKAAVCESKASPTGLAHCGEAWGEVSQQGHDRPRRLIH